MAGAQFSDARSVRSPEGVAVISAFADLTELGLKPAYQLALALDKKGKAPALLVFLEVFRVTITPLTIALGIEPGGRAFRVHRLAPPPAPRQGLPGGER